MGMLVEMCCGIAKNNAMEMKTSLCTNCENVPVCTFHNGHQVIYCEEHKTEQIEEIDPLAKFEQQYAKEGLVFTHFEGLCGSCDFKNNCSWRTPESIIFSCEHYL